MKRKSIKSLGAYARIEYLCTRCGETFMGDAKYICSAVSEKKPNHRGRR